MDNYSYNTALIVCLLIACVVARKRGYIGDLYYFLRQKNIAYGVLQNLKRCSPCQTPYTSYFYTKRILIISFDNRTTEYIELFRKQNAMRCAAEGISFRFTTDTGKHSDKPIYWLKMYLVWDALREGAYDMVCWLDSDALLTGDMPFREALQRCDVQEAGILCSLDHSGLSLSYVNAGFFCVKPKGIRTLMRVMKYVQGEEAEWPVKKCWQQDLKTHQWGVIFAKSCYEQEAINRVAVDFPGEIAPIPHCICYGNGAPYPRGPAIIHSIIIINLNAMKLRACALLPQAYSVSGLKFSGLNPRIQSTARMPMLVAPAASRSNSA